jgi:hypothetical protein
MKEESSSTDHPQLHLCQVVQLLFAGENARKFHKISVTKIELTTFQKLK